MYLDEIKMQDLYKSFNRQTSDSESEEDYSTNNMNITKTDMPTSTQNNALHIDQMTSNPTTNETYTEDMDVDSLTTSPTVTMTNITFKEMEGHLSTIRLTSQTMSAIHSPKKDSRENSSTDDTNGTMTINVITNNRGDIEMEEPLTLENITLFTITNTMLTPITITLPKSSFGYKNNDEILPDLQPIEKETTPEEQDYKYVENSEEEPTVMDDNVVVQNGDIEFLHKEPARLNFSSKFIIKRRVWATCVNILQCVLLSTLT